MHLCGIALVVSTFCQTESELSGFQCSLTATFVETLIFYLAAAHMGLLKHQACPDLLQINDKPCQIF